MDGRTVRGKERLLERVSALVMSSDVNNGLWSSHPSVEVELGSIEGREKPVQKAVYEEWLDHFLLAGSTQSERREVVTRAVMGAVGIEPERLSQLPARVRTPGSTFNHPQEWVRSEWKEAWKEAAHKLWWAWETAVRRRHEEWLQEPDSVVWARREKAGSHVQEVLGTLARGYPSASDKGMRLMRVPHAAGLWVVKSMFLDGSGLVEEAEPDDTPEVLEAALVLFYDYRGADDQVGDAFRAALETARAL